MIVWEEKSAGENVAKHHKSKNRLVVIPSKGCNRV